MASYCTLADPELRKEISSKTPFLFDETTHELYLPLPSPYEQFRLTPTRITDVDDNLKMMVGAACHYCNDVTIELKMLVKNDPAVYTRLLGPPFPLLPAHSERFVKAQQAATAKFFEVVKEGKLDSMSEIPVINIREVKPDGTDIYVGEVALGRSSLGEITDEEKRKELEKINMERAPGDEEIIWTTGACLPPAYFGRGIAAAAVSTLLKEWGVPHMRCKEVRASSFVSNPASQKAFQKIGFVKDEALSGKIYKVPDNKGGGTEEQVVLVWRKPN